MNNEFYRNAITNKFIAKTDWGEKKENERDLPKKQNGKTKAGKETK